MRNNSHNKLNFKNDNKNNSHLKNILNYKKIRKKLSQPKLFSKYDLDNLIESKIKTIKKNIWKLERIKQRKNKKKPKKNNKRKKKWKYKNNKSNKN